MRPHHGRSSFTVAPFSANMPPTTRQLCGSVGVGCRGIETEAVLSLERNGQIFEAWSSGAQIDGSDHLLLATFVLGLAAIGYIAGRR
jgi:hypothetical protein